MMALNKEGVWGVMNGTEAALVEDADDKVKEHHAARRDKELATAFLSADHCLCIYFETMTIQYLFGEN